MQVLAVLSQKGGTGKTTLAGHIAVQAELSGAGPVAVLDADPQESLAEWGTRALLTTLSSRKRLCGGLTGTFDECVSLA